MRGRLDLLDGEIELVLGDGFAVDRGDRGRRVVGFLAAGGDERRHAEEGQRTDGMAERRFIFVIREGLRRRLGRRGWLATGAADAGTGIDGEDIGKPAAQVADWSAAKRPRYSTLAPSRMVFCMFMIISRRPCVGQELLDGRPARRPASSGRPRHWTPASARTRRAVTLAGRWTRRPSTPPSFSSIAGRQLLRREPCSCLVVNGSFCAFSHSASSAGVFERVARGHRRRHAESVRRLDIEALQRPHLALPEQCRDGCRRTSARPRRWACRQSRQPDVDEAARQDVAARGLDLLP